ncbi:MAG: hypothetical protein ACFFEY_15140 [Candidatus Thorarchaeota archaeon]
MKERIWNIRNYINKLENIKLEIIDHLNSLKELDNTTKGLWISDVKEFYYNTISAWEMINVNLKLETKNVENSKTFLYIARNFLSKLISELNIFESTKSSKLIFLLDNLFNECWEEFWTVFKNSLIKEETIKENERIVKISDLEYQLPCSVCGKIAVIFKIGFGRFDKKESLVFRGITHERSLSIELAETLFNILQKKNLSLIHQFMKKYHSFEGLDAYCPECDRIYCWEHYDAREEYDDGFYDCTYGICPRGHKRMIDD